MYFHTINLWYGSCAIQNKEIKMKSLSLKVMTLLMAASVLSASGCFNENEMSSPEGTVKGFLKALDAGNPNKMQSCWVPGGAPWKDLSMPKGIENLAISVVANIALDTSDVKTTLVSEKEGRVMLDDKKWHTRKWATVEVSYKFRNKLNEENAQATVKLVKSDNKWYIERWSGF